MPAANLLALIDDIATLLDDVSLLTKVAATKTAGVVGDDLALNAHQVAGIRAERELPVVWAVAKGSFKNKAILVPTAMAISALANWAVTPLLMVGGAFLCYEGFEKLAHRYLHGKAEEDAELVELVQVVADPAVDLVAFEKEKIRGAVRTDFILSAEIITITLGMVAEAPLLTQLIVMCVVGVLMTVGVYGLVAGIVKLDDLGLYLSQREGSRFRMRRRLGLFLLWVTPWLMKALAVAGTVAMFLVGGGILVHGFSPVAHGIEALEEVLGALPVVGALLHALLPSLLKVLFGVASGAVVLVGVGLVKRIGRRFKRKKAFEETETPPEG